MTFNEGVSNEEADMNGIVETSGDSATENEGEITSNIEPANAEVDHNSVTGDINVVRKRKAPQISIRKFIKRNSTSYSANNKKKKIIDQALMRFIVRDLQPVSVVDDIGFNEFLYTLDPRYPLPSRKHVRDVLLADMYSKTKVALGNILKSVKYVAITFDGWTSCARQGYLTTTGHFLYKHEPTAVLLSIHEVLNSATAENLKGLIEENVLSQYSFNLVAAVTDNGANMLATCNLLQVPTVPCSAHTIQLVVNSAILKSKLGSSTSTSKSTEPNLSASDGTAIFSDEIDENELLIASEHVSVYIILKKCKLIVRFFNSSPKKLQLLRRELQLRGIRHTTLIQSVYTRWNSSYKMLERISEMIDAINFVLMKEMGKPKARCTLELSS